MQENFGETLAQADDLQTKFEKCCEDYVAVLENIADTLKTIDDEFLQNILGKEKHESFKKHQIERQVVIHFSRYWHCVSFQGIYMKFFTSFRNRLKAERKRLSARMKEKHNCLLNQNSISTGNGQKVCKISVSQSLIFSAVQGFWT